MFVHEVQHLIQEYEGFANGSNPGAFVQKRQFEGPTKFDEFVYDFDQYVSKSNDRYDAIGKLLNSENYKDFRDSLDSKGIEELSRIYQSMDKDTFMSNYDYSIKTAKEDLLSPYEKYIRTAGEVEARNAEPRMDMDMDERRESLAEDTEDVACKDQIFISNAVNSYSRSAQQTVERKTLVGVHNISEEKLRKALKLGGLANPSIAVIDSENQKHEDFGDISLVLPSNVLNGEKTYSGDAWSPTYPKIIRKLSSKDYSKLAKRVRKSEENNSLANSILGIYEQFLEGEVQIGIEYLFLKENGYQPKDITSGGMDITRQYFLDKFDIKDDGYEDYQKATKAPDDVWIEFNKWRYANGKQSIYDYRTKKITDNLSKFGDTEERKAFIIEPYLVKEFSSFNSFMSQMRKAELHKDEIDVRATLDNAKNEVVERKLSSEFEKWLEEFIEESGAEEVFFDGYTPNGNRRYKKAILENISKKMKSKGKLNAYDDTGLGATRSMVLKKMTSLDEIKSKKGLLQTDEAYKEKYEHLKDELINLSGELAERLTESANAFYAVDAANRRIQEALFKKNSVSYLNKEYGYEIDKKSDLAKRLNQFKEDLVTMPSKYFETKFERPVKLNEFSAEVVPSTTSNDIKQALRENGLNVVEYNAEGQDSRQAALNEAIHA